MNFIVDVKESSKHNNLIFISVLIGKKIYQAVLDSGSTLSFVQPWIAEQMEDKLIRQKERKIKLIQDTSIILKRSIILPIEYEDELCVHNFYLYDKMKYDLLLGVDFMRKFKVDIRFGTTNSEEENNKTISRNSLIEDVDNEYCQEIEVECTKVLRTKGETFVSSHSMVAIDCLTDFNEYVGIFTSNLQTESIYGIKMYPSLLSFNGNYSVHLMNPNDFPVFIPSQIILGYIVSLESFRQNTNMAIEDEDLFEQKEFNIDIADERKHDYIENLLNNYQDVFTNTVKTLKKAVGVQHEINLNSDIPIKQRAYRTSVREKEIINSQVKEMLENDIIEPSTSPYSSPVVLVKKRNGKYRFCVDYRKLNAITIKDSYPLPLIQDLIESFAGCQYFTVMDLCSGYWQVPMKPEDKHKTAFITSTGLYQFKTLPFGLVCAPATFQRFVQKVMGDMVFKCVVVYLDDILIYSKTFEEHVEHIEMVLQKAVEFNLSLNQDKCIFATNKVTYLGFVISNDGLSPDPEKLKAVRDFPRPKCVRDIRSFLGLTGFYRQFVESYANIAKPLTNLLKKDVPFIWKPECEDSFNYLKQNLMESPILAQFTPGLPIVIYTDASGYGVGAILTQIIKEKEHTIAYASKTLNAAQQKYSISEREALAIVFAVKKFRPYVFGQKFTIKTDHCGLCYIMQVRDPNNRLARWAMFLQQYNFDVEYKSGKQHLNVDCLSRYCCEEPDPDLGEFPVLMVETEDMADLQRIDEWCSQIITALKSDTKGKLSKNFKIVDEVLYRVMNGANGNEKLLLCAPKKLRRKILEELHDAPTSGHLGFIETFIKCRDRFYWPHIERTVRNYVSNCQSCQVRKNDPGPAKGLLQPIACPDFPFQFVGCDILGPITTTSRNNKYIIILIDHYTKWLEAGYLKNTKSATLANWIWNNIVLKYGAIERLITDQGRSFCSKFMEDFYKLSNCHHLRTSPYLPETNGQAERMCKVVKDMLSHYVNENLTNWDLLLSRVVFAYNTSQQSSTKETPYRLLFGREPRLPIDEDYKLPNNFVFGMKLREQLEDTQALVKLRIDDKQRSQKQNYDAKHHGVVFKVRDKVALYTPRKIVGISEKFIHKWDGPYEIIEVISPVTYKIRRVCSPRSYKVVHIKRLKRWYNNEINELEPETSVAVKEDNQPKELKSPVTEPVKTPDEEPSLELSDIDSSEEEYESMDDDDNVSVD